MHSLYPSGFCRCDTLVHGRQHPDDLSQNTALGRRLSARRGSPKELVAKDEGGFERAQYRRSNSYRSEQDLRQSNATQQKRRSRSATRSSPSHTTQPTASPAASPGSSKKTSPRRPATSDHMRSGTQSSGGPLAYPRGHPLAPIPGSPYVSDASSVAPSRKSMSTQSINDRYARAQAAAKMEQHREEDEGAKLASKYDSSTLGRSRSKSSSYLSYRAPQPQSLSAALEMIALSDSQSTASTISTDKVRTVSENGHGGRSATPSLLDPRKLRISTDKTDGLHTAPASPMWPRGKKKDKVGPPSPRRPIPALPHFGGGRSVSTPAPATINGKVISTPIFNPGKSSCAPQPSVDIDYHPQTRHGT